MKKVKLIRNLFFILNLMIISWLMLCMYASYHDTSGKPSIVSLLSFTLPFAIVSNFIFAFFWIIFMKRWKWFGFISILALIVSWPISRSIFGFNAFPDKANDKQKTNIIKVMTYNVHLFNLGGWTRDKSTQRRILDFIKEESPDILCLQEYYYFTKDDKEPFTSLIADLGYPYFKFSANYEYKKSRLTSKASKNEKVGIGVIIFSKHPLTEDEEISLGQNHKALKVKVNYNKKYAFNLIATHLQSFRFGNKEMNYIEKLKSEKNIETTLDTQTKGIAKKLVMANSIRAKQANIIKEFLLENNLPVIICGDFNDIPGSYTYQTIKKNLEDPFVKKGFGLSRTFSKISPTLRIDHILYDKKNWDTESYKVINVNMSDHYPVVAELKFK